MMIKKFLALLIFAPGLVSAEGWSGEGELGYTTTSGNTESESLVAKLGIVKIHGQWEHKTHLEALKTSTDNVTSNDNVVFTEKSQYNFDEKSYAFGKLYYADDKFSGFDYQASLAFGAGARFIQSAPHTLDAAAGIGYRETRDTLSQQVSDEGVMTADLIYEYLLSATATFSETINIESGQDNTRSESQTVLKTKINGNMASKITYQLKHNSSVPIGNEKTDRILTVSLVYNF